MKVARQISGLPWQRLNPVVSVGVVEFMPVGHVVAATALAVLTWAVAETNPDETAALGLSSATAVALFLMAYALVQTGRVAHEAGHALAGVSTGRKLTAVRLTPLRMMADWPPNELWDAPASSRRLTAAAGSMSELLFGAALILAVTTLGTQWASPVQEVVLLAGILHVSAVANLLPVQGSDGHVLFGTAWRTRPSWLSLLVAQLPQIAVPVALTALLFEQGIVRGYLSSLMTPSNLVALVLAFLLLPFAARRFLLPRNDFPASERGRDR